MISERTMTLYEQHPPQRREGDGIPTLAELLHEVEVAAKFGVPREELAAQLDLEPELFDALIADAGIEFR